MPNPSASLDLSPDILRVLQTHGVRTLGHLAACDVSELQGHFVGAVKEGRFRDMPPSLVKVASWIEKARALVERGAIETPLIAVPTARVKRTVPGAEKKRRSYAGSGSQKSADQLVQLRSDRHFTKKRDPEAPEPAPETSRGGVELEPRASHVTESAAQELNPETSRALHRRRKAPVLRRPEETANAKAPPQSDGSTRQAGEETPKSRFRTFDDYKEGRIRVRPLDRHSVTIGEDTERDTASEQGSFEAEQEEKRRMPRWRIRGVRYPDPGKALFGAFITLMAIFLTILTAIACVLFPFYLEDRRLEFAALAGANLLFALFYLFFATGVRCRTCTCHLFYSRRCLKNAKAHRLLGGFPLVAQAIHMLIFRWFRCMYCGTAIRLKDDRED